MMRVGILTYHKTHNYGAYLQSYALTNYLNQKKGIQAEIIDYNTLASELMQIKCIKFNWKQMSSIWYNFRRYIVFAKAQKQLPTSKWHLVTNRVDKFCDFVANKYDLIVVGSDEVWVLDGYRGFPNAYWLPNLKGIKKASYGASSRNTIDSLDTETVKAVKNYVQDFSYIGVRDTATYNLIEQIAGQAHLHMNCDPTFLYDFNIDRNEGKKILVNKFKVNSGKKVVGLMCGEPVLAKRIVDKFSNEIEIVSLYDYYDGTKGYSPISPFQWINVISALDGLITTFFHGMVFAIKSNVPFIVIEGRNLASSDFSKNYDLLKRNGIEKYYAQISVSGVDDVVNSNVSEFINQILSNCRVDFSEVVENERKYSESFINWVVDQDD